MNRNEIILRHVKKDGEGIEIGPSHNPVAPKKNGYRVHILDHLSREDLIEKYRDHGVNLDNIEEVDFVWHGEPFLELTQKSKHYDWIIASHVIEHTPDLIAFLNDCASILKDDGILTLAIPDKRYCFDHFRPVTGISKIIDSHFQKAKIHSPGNVAEYFLNVTSKAGKIAWDEKTSGEYKFLHDLNNAQFGIDVVKNQQAYLDIHAWCFVPHSFRLLIEDLHSLKLISFREIEFQNTIGHEFFITLSKNGIGHEKSRVEMALQVEIELGKGNLN
jgi:predicted SAM-dependent methyltransferase